MPLPYVIAYVTMSADGKIASRTGESRLSCPHDLRRLHSLRASSDAVMVGARTVIIDDPLLTTRYVKGPNPVRVVVDGKLSIPLNARVVRDRSSRTVVVASDAAPRDKVEALRGLGVDVVTLPSVKGSPGVVSLTDVMRTLHDMGLRIVLVEGGGTLLWGLFREGLVNEFRVTIAPYVVGGSSAVTPVEGQGFGSRGEWVRLRLVSYSRCRCGGVHLVFLVAG